MVVNRLVLCITKRETAGFNNKFSFIVPASRCQRYYYGTDDHGGEHCVAEESIMTAIPSPPSPCSNRNRCVAQRPVQTPHKRKTAVQPRSQRIRKRVSRSIKLNWTHSEDEEVCDQIYTKQAKQLFDFLLEKIPCGIADKVFEAWLRWVIECKTATVTKEVRDQILALSRM